MKHCGIAHPHLARVDDRKDPRRNYRIVGHENQESIICRPQGSFREVSPSAAAISSISAHQSFLLLLAQSLMSRARSAKG